MPRTASTGKPSNGSGAPVTACSSPAPIFSTASGCGASADGSTLASRHCARDVHEHGHRGLRRTRRARAAGKARTAPPTQRRGP
jgi:hypothetical protein